MIIFTAQDAGPANYLARIINDISHDYICLCSDISKPIFDRFQIVNHVEYKFNDIKDASLIVTGTCWSNGLDKQLIRWANENNIVCITIIEHWSWYKERFDIEGELIFPDFIIVNDQLALKEAINSGIPQEKLFALGNVVLEDLKKSLFDQKSKSVWKNELGLEQTKPVISFISENYTVDCPKGSARFQGINEIEIMQEILASVNEDGYILIKLHPSENAEKYNKALEDKRVSLYDGNVMDLINYSDYIVGMTSMLLIEASMLRNDVLSYLPENVTIDFAGTSQHYVYKVKSHEELSEILNGKKKVTATGISNFYEGSKNRIVNFIKEKIS